MQFFSSLFDLLGIIILKRIIKFPTLFCGGRGTSDNRNKPTQTTVVDFAVQLILVVGEGDISF